MTVPSNLQYTAEHEWLTITDGIATVGITAFAADALGDVVYVDLPDVGTTVTAGEACGELESTKSVSDLYSPVDGEVVEVNPAVDEAPDLLNQGPYDAWLLKIRVTGEPALLDAAAYEQLIASA
ncbi:glycine cleavage system protein GcvH [Nocardioides maradonensis]